MLDKKCNHEPCISKIDEKAKCEFQSTYSFVLSTCVPQNILIVKMQVLF